MVESEWGWPVLNMERAPYEVAHPPEDPPEGSFLWLFSLALQGRCSFRDPRLAKAALEEGLDVPDGPPPAGTPPQTPPVIPCDGWFADIAEDRVPDIGVCLGRVLGPLAEEAAAPRAEAFGVLAMAPYMAPRVRPLDRYFQDRRASPPVEREAVRVVDRTPPLIWMVREGEARPLLWANGGRITGPIHRAPLEDGAPMRSMEGHWVARMIPLSGGGALAALAVRLPSPVDPASIEARMAAEIWRYRLHHPGLPWERCLRDRGEVLYRAALEMCWLAAADYRASDPDAADPREP